MCRPSRLVRSVGEGALHPISISLIYERLVRQAFDNKLLGAMTEAQLARWIKAVSSHSIRVGSCRTTLQPASMQAYGWRDSKTVMRYGGKLVAKSGSSARMAARMSGSATGDS